MEYSAASCAEILLPAREQSSYGNHSPNQSNQKGDNIFIDNKGSVFVSKNNSFEAKQEALFLVQHPTTLQVTGLRWTSWFGDNEPFMDVELTNTSELPALDVHVSMLNPKTGASINHLKPYKLNESYTLRILKGSAISIPAKAKMSWPIASKSDIESILQRSCITGAGLEFQPPRIFDEKHESQTASSYSQLFLFKITYKTIFKQQMSFIASGVVDTSSRDSDFMVPRDSNKVAPLKCVGDPGWNSVLHVGADE